MKWRWAGHVARMPPSEWALIVTKWRDSAWQTAAGGRWLRPERPTRRRWMKFEYALRKFCGDVGHGEWMVRAQDREAWRELSVTFVDWATTP
eukprot:4484399-Pyramimonas_sp.AAC.1